MIKIKELTKTFGRNRKIDVIKGITLELPLKGLVVILGQSGSGKTTLLNILGGLDQATSGTIDYFSKEQSQQTIDSIRRNDFGFIFQNYHLLSNESVYDNIALTLRVMGYQDEDEIEKRVLHALKMVNMVHFRARIVTQLSGGQQQRIAIARAIVKNPKIILADEPTGNLDSKNTFDVMNIIKKISETKLVILVSHEKNLVKHYADRIIEIKDGLIIHDEVNERQSHFLLDDSTIFLKDLKKDELNPESTWNIGLYREEDDDEHKNITLVVKNNTLYLNVEKPIQHVRIINRENHINIEKDLTALEYERMQSKTPFDLDEFTWPKDVKINGFIKTWQVIKKSFFEMFIVTKKTALFLTIFFLMGISMAIAIPFINNIQSNRLIFSSDQENYIQAQGMLTSGVNYRWIQSMKEADDDSFYINVFRSTPIIFDIPSIDGVQQPQLNARLGLSSHLNESQMVYGRLPEKTNELVIDFSLILADFDRANSILKKAGIWDYQQLIGRKIKNIYLPDSPFEIVGIVNSGAFRVYGMPESLVYLAGNNGHDILSVEYFKDNEKFSLDRGALPRPYDMSRKTYEVIVPIEMINRYQGLSTHDFSVGPFQIDFNVYVTGIYTYTGKDFIPVTLLPHEDLSYRLFQYSVTQIQIYIYTQNPQQTIFKLEEAFNNVQTNWPYQIAQNEGKIFLLGIRTLMIIGILLILLSFISVYFINQSSLNKDIQEIGVYRALGVKKLEILKRYFIQNMVRLTMTSIVGYLLFTILVANVDEALLGGSYYFYVTPVSILLGIGLIYLIGLISVIPVVRLMKMTPAQLLAYDDIV